MSLQYVVYDYWEYGYAEGDAILQYGSASVTADATVSADGIRLRTAVGSITGNATVSAFGTRIQFANAYINASAVLTADGTRVRTAIGSIECSSDVSALGGVIYSANAAINGTATVSAYANLIWSGYAYINANSTVTAKGAIIGEDWIDTVPSIDSWSQISSVYYAWNPITSNITTWINTRSEDPYVEIDYWLDGYTDDRYDYWIKSSNVQDNWMRQ